MINLYESNTWRGGEGTGDTLDVIGPSIVSRKKESPAVKNKTVGTVILWNSDRGFGFARLNSNKEPDVFIHISDLREAGIESLRYGEKLAFQVKTFRGKTIAVDIEEIF